MPHPVFTPTAVAPERLDALTVGSARTIDRVAERLRRAADGGGLAHTLLVGPRGSGKTHTLAVALHRAGAEATDRLAVAWIAEDAVAIGSYVDLLVELIRALAPERAGEARELRRSRQSGPLERLLLASTDDRPLVLVLENLDRIFRSLGSAGQHDLRGFVETASRILLVASTPLLFEGVSSRDEPWFGSFDIEHLPAIDAEAGAALIRCAALEAGRLELAAFVDSPSGRNRLRAVEALAGGLPRLWHILAGCVDIPSLDALVPAVEDLLDELAPYYQQRLWDLPPTEQKIVVELGRDVPVRTVRELAESTGVSPQVAATALGRLAEARWVRAFKAPGTDQRTTRYELREPLLRHHLAFRDGRGSALPFIVEFLKTWYARSERRRLLVGLDPGSPAEQHLVGSLFLDPPARSDEPWSERSPDDLVVAARCWIAGHKSTSGLVGSPALGAAVEVVVVAASRSGPARVGDADYTVARSAAAAAGGSAADRVAVGLRSLTHSFDGDDRDLLTLICACWDGRAEPSGARDEVSSLLAARPAEGPLTLTIRDEQASWIGEAGDPANARDLYAALIVDRIRLLGTDDPDTLSTRHHHARLTGAAGDPHAARDLYAALIPDRVRVLGTDHPDTLTTRTNHAHWTGQAGDPAAARDLYAALVPDLARVLGADHPATLASRNNHAHCTGRSGDPTAARDLCAAILPDLVRVLGVDHLNTMTSRANHAYWTGEAGDPATARDLFAALIPDRAHVLGTDHPDTLTTRANHAYWTGEAGDPATARDLFAALIPDRARVLGADHPDTLTGRHNHAAWTGEAGDPTAARDLYAGLVPHGVLAVGADHPDTLRSRHNHAAWTGEAGDSTAARDLYAGLVPDLIHVRGPYQADARSSAAGWLHCDGEPDAVLNQLGPASYSHVVQALLGSARQHGSRLAALVRPLAGHDEARSTLTAVLVRQMPLPAGRRVADFRAAAAALPPEVSAPLLPTAAALDGDAEALAGLPQELREIAHQLIALDAAALSTPPARR